VQRMMTSLHFQSASTCSRISLERPYGPKR
jgi:hypothetical protein